MVVERRMSGDKVLVVSDDDELLAFLEPALVYAGFFLAVERSGARGLRVAREELYCLICLDRVLPDMDGFDVCRKLKGDAETSTIPILMFSGSGEAIDIMLALTIGAEDCIRKPVSPRELVARVEAILRRFRPGGIFKPEDERLVWGDVVIDAARHEVLVRGRAVSFTVTEFRLLRYFATRAGRVLSRDLLVKNVLGKDAGSRTIDVHVQSIRKKLGRCADQIATVRGIGYRPLKD